MVRAHTTHQLTPQLHKPATSEDAAVSAHLAPATMIMFAPHLVDTIMQHTPRSTLVTCLRVSRLLHNAAGKVLYHTVRIHGTNAHGLFDGIGWEDHLDEDPRNEGEEGALGDPMSGHAMFKNRLLERVRVLSIGSHSYCQREGRHSGIDDLGALIKSLLRGVHTVKIVLPPREGWAAAPSL